MAKSVLRLKNVSMRYDKGPCIFENISFDMKQGDFYFLTGPSGAGKTSLIRMIYLGLRNYTGTFEIFGQDASKISIEQIPYFRQKIGVVFQDFFLLNHMSAVDNVALPLRVLGVSQRQSRIHAKEILEWVGLGDKLESHPDTLSGGEKQRVSIARAVIGKPRLLLADEPTGNVDDKIAVKLLYLFEELNKMGTNIILATHNRDLPGEFPHPRIHLEHGKLSLINLEPHKKVKHA